jgi:outer membrane protein assembly factor BamB
MRFYLVVAFILSSLLSFGQTARSWPNSRGNAQLQGSTAVEFPQKIKLKWNYKASGIFKSAPVIAEGKIVVGSTSGELLCLDFNGKLLWNFKTENSIEAPSLIQDGVVYFGNLSGSFFAIDLKTGAKKWEYKTDNQIMGAPAFLIVEGKKVLAVGSYDYYLHGVDAATGKGLWKYESDNFLNAAPAIANGKAVFGGCDGFLHLVNMKDGKPDSKIEVATYVPSSPAIADGKAYLGDYDGGVTCIDLTTKKKIWSFKNPVSDLPFIASPSVIDDKLVIGSRDKFIYCFNRKTGEPLWKKNTGNRVDASTVVNKKQVLLVNMRGDLMLLNLSDGSTVWTYELGSGVINTPAVVQNAIVVAASDGNVYFLE